MSGHSRVTSRALLAPSVFWLVRFAMDEETKAWCEASGLTGNTVKSLAEEEFFSMQALRAFSFLVPSPPTLLTF